MTSRLLKGLVFGAAAVIASGIVAAGASWFIVTGRMLDAVPGFVAAARQAGWSIEIGSLRRAPWPWGARLHLTDIVGLRLLGSTSLRFSLVEADLTILPSAPRQLRIEPGRVGAVRVGAGQDVPVGAQAALILAPLDGVGPVVAAAEALSAGSEQGGVRIDRLDARIEAGAVAGTVGPILVAPPFPAPFEEGATVSARAVATPPIPIAATPGESARAWQAEGGRVDVSDLSVEWGRLRVSGTVSGGLDAALQPVAVGRLQLVGAPDVLAAAAQAGVVARGPAAAANAVLGLLTLAAKGGPILVPVQVRDQTLTVAQFPLLRVPTLAWDPP